MQIENKKQKVAVQYRRVVHKDGNIIAQQLLKDVFIHGDELWRGLGVIPQSGLKINEDFSSFDAEKHFHIEVPESVEPQGCICGQILRGVKTPDDCSLFAKKCTPSDPVGACMVSAEGTCSTFYKYRA